MFVRDQVCVSRDWFRNVYLSHLLTKWQRCPKKMYTNELALVDEHQHEKILFHFGRFNFGLSCNTVSTKPTHKSGFKKSIIWVIS